MNASVIITGGSGLLAINWALAIRDNYTVTLGLHERDISISGVNALRLDLESVEYLISTFEKIRPQLVVHTAGLTNVEMCEAKPDLAQHVNVKLATNVSKACAALGLPLVHISTDHLFSGELSLVDETCPVTPNNVYGHTKAEAELRVLEAYPQALVVRTNFYGWGPSYRHSFSDLIIETLRSGEGLTLFKDVFYTPILIEVLTETANDLVSINVSGILHLVGDDRISKHEFGLKVAEKFNLDSSLISTGYLTEQESLVQRPHDMSLSNQKATRLLGRKLGGVDEHLTRLLQQEKIGLALEMQKI